MSDLIIVGSGREVVKDLLRARERWPEADLMAVNHTGFFVGRARYLVSIHAHGLGPIRELWRERDWQNQGTKPLPTTIAPSPAPGVDLVWKPPQGLTGTSSLYAVRVALVPLQYDRVLLAGVPLDGSGRFYDDGIMEGTPITWPHEQDRGPWELAAREEFHGRVRSVSGWTADLLGSAFSDGS